ncbi:LPS biosynthesis protein [Slackia heliotrinireducens]|uniref:LPS biosynthesis protein n=1 Tax=Slackia heliotrinireducens (strain ATCC 29202 / DSM 20476 / NCTC 11029 / RHS 1) TaxID=471855 RepID=C7N5S6_SLAHD|nr:LicD family protein [Slackia heliotrinireducens]ACV22261.1 LPS biosynthesis protein [Slackia heliotrinireducens DSM 20476]VEH00423.1 LPS biosynthesis protein [Slackia heliotrinireducens]
MNKLSTFEAFKHLHGKGAYKVVEGDDLQALQIVLLDMMLDIDAACKRACIDYMLFAGSCLGAYRDGGFIPWDDDLDIAMDRMSYERFCKAFNDELGDGYILQTPLDTKEYGLTFARIRKRGTTLKCRDDLLTDGECGVYIDLFIWESAPDNPILRALHGFGSLAIGFLYSCRRFAWYGDTYLNMAQGDAQLSRVFKLKNAIGKVLSFASIDAWTHAWYRWNALCKNEKSRLLTIPNARKKYFGEIYERSVILPMRRLDFEGKLLMGPNSIEDYLAQAFGADYMTPPPPEAREKHIVFEFDLGTAVEDAIAKRDMTSGFPEGD